MIHWGSIRGGGARRGMHMPRRSIRTPLQHRRSPFSISSPSPAPSAPTDHRHALPPTGSSTGLVYCCVVSFHMVDCCVLSRQIADRAIDRRSISLLHLTSAGRHSQGRALGRDRAGLTVDCCVELQVLVDCCVGCGGWGVACCWASNND